MSDSRNQPPVPSSWSNAEDRLDSWKEIASYLQRTLATVRRWEKKEGLPVHRHVHHKKASVYAYRSEIDTWLANRSPGLEDDQPMGWFSFLGKNPKTTIGITIGVVLTLLAGLLVWMGSDFSSNPEILNFQQRDWVLIADFENRTGEAVFDGVLESALRREIANSQFVNVVPRERIEDTLRLMRKPLDTRIDPEVAREISLRDGGIKALLTGRVEKLDSTYLLSVELVAPSVGQTIAATSKEAGGQDEVLATLRFLSRWSRETLGETLTDLQASEEQLERVTTPSLRALQLFTKAEALISPGRSDLAEGLLKQAVDIDPEFASAHIYLAHAIQNQRKPTEEYLPYAEKAFQLADGASQRERYFIHGSYYQMKGEREKAVQAYESLLVLYPDHFWAINNLANLLRADGEDQRALTYAVRGAELRPNSFAHTIKAALQLLRSGDLAKAKNYVARTLDLMNPEDLEPNTGPTMQLMWFPAFEALLHADPETALREANRSLERLRSVGGKRFVNDSPMGAFYLTLGKIELARDWFEESTEPGAQRQVFLAATAYVEDDHEAMTEHLQQVVKARESLRRTPRARALSLPSPFVLLLNRGGLLSELADLNLSIRPSAPDFVKELIRKNRGIHRGILAVSRDNRIEGLRMLGDALSSISLTDSISAEAYFMGSEVLAEAWREREDSTNAAQVLRAALEKEAFLLLDQSVLTGPLWLKLQAQLSQLYREMGRNEDALKIEDGLRSLLALADPGHPILRQLDHTKKLALREPAN